MDGRTDKHEFIGSSLPGVQKNNSRKAFGSENFLRRSFVANVNFGLFRISLIIKLTGLREKPVTDLYVRYKKSFIKSKPVP